jgi:alkanesulfonate monooxygenase SsuD/methylene tetrahydromethanopterin reductase-like flavin-dependent oxidoreductase (luciferase family)
MQVGMMPLFQGQPGTSDVEIYKQELELALEAEAMGFDLLMPVEHHFFDYAMIPDNTVLLSYVAARTKTIKLMPCAFILPWNDPLRVVEKAILLDHLSEGRVVVGFGRGLAKREFDAFRVKFSESRERFEQAAGIILGGLETGFVEGDTPHYRQPRIEVRPRPFKSFRDRTFMVGMSPQSVETAGRLGLGCMKFAQGPWEEAKVEIDRHRAIFKQSWGVEAPPPIAADCMVCDPSLRRAEALAREHITRYWVQLMDHYELLSDNFAKAGAAYASYAQMTEHFRSTNQQALVDSYIECNIWGDPARILDKLTERRELLGDFTLAVSPSFGGMAFEDVRRSLRSFADRVMPEIKTW